MMDDALLIWAGLAAKVETLVPQSGSLRVMQVRLQGACRSSPLLYNVVRRCRLFGWPYHRRAAMGL